jgi:hypothetical protein
MRTPKIDCSTCKQILIGFFPSRVVQDDQLLPFFVTPSFLRAFVAPLCSGLNGCHFPDFPLDSSVYVQYIADGCSAVPPEGVVVARWLAGGAPAGGLGGVELTSKALPKLPQAQHGATWR